MAQIDCPHCGFSKEIPADELPKHEIKFKCPSCDNHFPFDPIVASLIAHENPQRPSVLHFPDPDLSITPTIVEPGTEGPVPLEPPASKAPKVEMMLIGELFTSTWQSFKARILTLLGIYFLGAALAFVVGLVMQVGIAMLAKMLGDSIVGPIIGILLMITLMSLVGSWIAAACIYAIVDETGIREALGQSLSRIWAFFWLFSLLGLIVGGGSMLLVVPGILFFGWFVFAQYVLAAEETRGMDALLKSREYVRGYGWAIFGRLALLYLVAIAVMIPFSLIPFIGPLVSLFVGPFVLVYCNEIYQDLRAMKPNLIYSSTTGVKATYLSIGIIGFLAVPIIIFLSAGPAVKQGLSMMINMSTAGISSQMDEEEMRRELEKQIQLQNQQQAAQANAMNASDQNHPQDVMLYVYSLNYKGEVKLNGESFYQIVGEENMNYNHTAAGKLAYGRNTIKVDYKSLPDPWKVELRIKAYRHNKQTGKEEFIDEWVMDDKGGSRRFEVYIPKR